MKGGSLLKQQEVMENAEVWSPINRDKDLEHSVYGLDYVHIYYKGKDYRINPIFIQVVTG